MGTTKAPEATPKFEEPDAGDGVPKTGDTLSIMPSLAMMILAAGVIAAYGMKLKKNR